MADVYLYLVDVFLCCGVRVDFTVFSASDMYLFATLSMFIASSYSARTESSSVTNVIKNANTAARFY